MRTLAIIALILAGAPCLTRGADSLSRYETWITGQAFAEKGVLMFRTDKPVQGNTTGKVVLLGASKEAARVLLPAYALALEKHLKLRLYGVLLPVPDKPVKGKPSVIFITWKMHLPSDPDELPAGQKMIIHKGDTVEGTTVRSPTTRR